MVIAEGRWLRTRDEVYLTLAKRWAKGTAILFAVGAVSGTVLSFELGLLWPGFMRYAGAIIGMPFSLEGFAFFTEAIFLGIYIYGWKRVSARIHWLSGVMVALSGAASGVFVVTANAWMLLRDRTNTFHRHALAISLVVAGVSAILQPISGDHSAKVVAETQPLKLAALEGQFKSERCAPLRIGGLPDPAAETTRFALEIPCGLSFLAHNDFNAEVKGLESAPPADRPPVTIVHVAFQIMVAAGFALAGVGVLTAFMAWRRRGLPDAPWLLWLLVAVSPLGFIAIEAGWTVTEVGRQPWVVYNILRTADAVTPMPGLIVPFLTFTLLYLFLAVIVVWLLWHQVVASPTIPAGAPSEETSNAVA